MVLEYLKEAHDPGFMLVYVRFARQVPRCYHPVIVFPPCPDRRRRRPLQNRRETLAFFRISVSFLRVFVTNRVFLFFLVFSRGVIRQMPRQGSSRVDLVSWSQVVNIPAPASSGQVTTNIVGCQLSPNVTVLSHWYRSCRDLERHRIVRAQPAHYQWRRRATRTNSLVARRKDLILPTPSSLP